MELDVEKVGVGTGACKSVLDGTVDPRTYLMLLAEKVLENGGSTPEAHAILLKFLRQEQWPEEWESSVVSIVMDVQKKIWDAKAAAEAEANREELQVYSLADVPLEAVKWLWPGKIPLGRVTVIYGEAGIGKTCLGVDLAARVSAGTEWPDGEVNSGAGKVLILNGEDSMAETVCPRLVAGGADLKNVSAMGKIQRVGGNRRARRFDLGADVRLLRQRVEAMGEVRLVLIDGLELFSGNLGLTKAQMRCILADLEELAAERGLSIVILSTSKKCELGVKNVWRVDCDVVHDRVRCFVPVRFAWGMLPDGMSFEVREDRLSWVKEDSPPTAVRTRGAFGKEFHGLQLQQQAKWLKDFLLKEGAQPTKVVLAAAKEAGWSEGQMRRAKEALNVVCRKQNVADGGWVWELRETSEALMAAIIRRVSAEYEAEKSEG